MFRFYVWVCYSSQYLYVFEKRFSKSSWTPHFVLNTSLNLVLFLNLPVFKFVYSMFFLKFYSKDFPIFSIFTFQLYPYAPRFNKHPNCIQISVLFMSMVILVVTADSVYQQNLFFSIAFQTYFRFLYFFLFLKETNSRAGMNAGQINDRQLTPCS